MRNRHPEPTPLVRPGGLYSYGDAAEILGVKTRQHISRLVRRGELRTVDISLAGTGSEPRVTGDSLLAFIRKRDMGPGPERKAAAG